MYRIDFGTSLIVGEMALFFSFNNILSFGLKLRTPEQSFKFELHSSLQVQQICFLSQDNHHLFCGSLVKQLDQFVKNIFIVLEFMREAPKCNWSSVELNSEKNSCSFHLYKQFYCFAVGNWKCKKRFASPKVCQCKELIICLCATISPLCIFDSLNNHFTKVTMNFANFHSCPLSWLNGRSISLLSYNLLLRRFLCVHFCVYNFLFLAY